MVRVKKWQALTVGTMILVVILLSITISSCFKSSNESGSSVLIPNIVFSTALRSTAVGMPTSVITVQTQTPFGSALNLTAPVLINLTSTSVSGTFSVATSPWSNVTQVWIVTGTSSASVYYKDSALGTPTITADEYPSAGWPTATQVVTVNPATISKLAFSTAVQSAATGTPTSKITIQTQNAQGNPVNVVTSTVISLTATSVSGTFASSTAGPWTLTSVTIVTNTSSADLYYKDTAVGTSTITADEAVDVGWTAGTQVVTINSATISKLAFSTSAPSAAADMATSKMTVQTQNSKGNAANVSTNTVISLTATSVNGIFSLTTTLWSNVITVTITSGKNSVDFYYKDSTVGTSTITADEAVDAGWTAASQVATINAATISKLAFTTSAPSATANVATAVMTIQTQNSKGNPVNVTADTVISLTSTSISGTFSLSSTSWADITSVTISSTKNSVSFYYKDTIAWVPTIIVDESPSAGWTAGNQIPIINPAAIASYIVTPTTDVNLASGNLGSTQAGLVTAKDAFNNTVTNASTTLTMSYQQITGTPVVTFYTAGGTPTTTYGPGYGPGVWNIGVMTIYWKATAIFVGDGFRIIATDAGAKTGMSAIVTIN